MISRKWEAVMVTAEVARLMTVSWVMPIASGSSRREVHVGFPDL
jgi:hypothetical protein